MGTKLAIKSPNLS